MTPQSQHDDNVVKLFSGTMVEVELRQQALREAGIDSRVVGLDLTASVGTALGGSVELWVHTSDTDRALAVLQRFDAKK